MRLADLVLNTLEGASELSGVATDEFVDWFLNVADQFAKYNEDIQSNADEYSKLDHLIIKIPHELTKE